MAFDAIFWRITWNFAISRPKALRSCEDCSVRSKHFCAQCLHDLDLLFGKFLRHADDHPVAFVHADESQADPRVAGRGFQNRGARLQAAILLSADLASSLVPATCAE